MDKAVTNNVLEEHEIKIIREGGKIWQKIKTQLFSEVSPGVTGAQLDKRALELFKEHGVEPAFYGYHDFPGYICVSVNDCIIHGLGNDTPLKSGDKITLDIGFKHKGIYIDSAATMIVDPKSNPEYQDFIDKCHKLLWAGIKTAKKVKESGEVLYSGDIASSIEALVKSWNDKHYSLIDRYVGHTIGRGLHMQPHIPNKGIKKGGGSEVSVGTAICIEPMLLKQTTGEHKVGKNQLDVVAKDDGAMTCHWEHMVLIKKDGIEVLTASEEEIEEFLK